MTDPTPRRRAIAAALGYLTGAAAAGWDIRRDRHVGVPHPQPGALPVLATVYGGHPAASPHTRTVAQSPWTPA